MLALLEAHHILHVSRIRDITEVARTSHLLTVLIPACDNEPLLQEFLKYGSRGIF